MSATIRISSAQLPTVIRGRTFDEKQKVNLAQILIILEQAGKRKSDSFCLVSMPTCTTERGRGTRKNMSLTPFPGY